MYSGGYNFDLNFTFFDCKCKTSLCNYTGFFTTFMLLSIVIFKFSQCFFKMKKFSTTQLALKNLQVLNN